MAIPALSGLALVAALISASSFSALAAEAAQPDPVVTIALALIGSVTSIITAGLTALVLIRTGKVLTTTQTVAKSVDGMKTELVKASIGQATAEGQLAGEQAQRDRAAGPQP